MPLPNGIMCFCCRMLACSCVACCPLEPSLVGQSVCIERRPPVDEDKAGTAMAGASGMTVFAPTAARLVTRGRLPIDENRVSSPE